VKTGVKKMGKEKFAEVHERERQDFPYDCRQHGQRSPTVKSFRMRSRNGGSGWKNFHHYPVRPCWDWGGPIVQSPEFAKTFEKYHKDLPAFLTKAIEYYCTHSK